MSRSSQIIRTSVIGIAANVLLAAFKSVVGIIAGSVAIVMDAVNNLSDALSSVITIIGTKLSQRPADRKHPFGFGRIEYFSAIIIAKQLSSDALVASGSDALFDAIITTATLISAGVMLIWHFSLDGILGALISLVIIKAGIEMLASPVNELLGARVSPDLVKEIKKELMGVEGVKGVFDIILHNYGPDVMIGSLHISVPDSMSAHEIHILTRKISTMIFERHGIILTVGIYATATQDSTRAELQSKVIQTLAAHKEIVQVHGFLYSENDRLLSVDVVPDISSHDDAALRKKLTEEIQKICPDLQVVIVIDHNYSE